VLVGHFAAGLVAKRIVPQLSLGTAVLAAMLADLLAFPLVLLGIEHFRLQPGAQHNRLVGDSIAYSHGLLMDAIWAGLFAATYFLLQRSARAAWVLFGAVLSHWLLDAVSHRPDMPLAPGAGAAFGLGLWNSIPATVVVEGGLWLAAITLYVRGTSPGTRLESWIFWGWIALLTLAWWGNIVATPVQDLGPAAAAGSLAFFGCLVAWAFWVNRLRPARA